MPKLKELAFLSPEALGKIDLAVYHFACAQGLPGSEKINTPACIKTLDEWAVRVRDETNRLLPTFHQDPAKYSNSESYFRTMVMITVLQRDLKVRYNPEKIPLDARIETEDVFIHSIISGKGGTCVTLPVVYAAVGRRLGYPIKLVAAQGDEYGHTFNRWDGLEERFNIEATNKGLTCPPDDYYRKGMYAATAMKDREEKCGYLKSQTPGQEFAGFLCERAICWLDLNNRREAVRSFALAFTDIITKVVWATAK
jgi:hypothetical protein